VSLLLAPDEPDGLAVNRMMRSVNSRGRSNAKKVAAIADGATASLALLLCLEISARLRSDSRYLWRARLGAADGARTHRALISRQSSKASEAVATVGNGGHFLALDRPRELTDLIIRFTASPSGSSGAQQ